MNRILLSTALLMSANTVSAEIILSDQLSISGFLDMSYTNTNSDINDNDESSLSFDQFEVDIQLGISEGVTAFIDIEVGQGDSVGDINGIEVSLEQAHFTSKINDALTFKAGRFLSYSGWETEEPTGLYQYSGAFGAQFYGAYQNGVSMLYSTGPISIAASVIDDTFGLNDGDGDAEDLGYEAMLAFSPTDAIIAKIFYLQDTIDDPDISNDGENQSNIDAWISFSSGNTTLAAEYATATDAGGIEGVDREGFLFMANQGITNKLSATIRYHQWEEENAAGTTVEDNSAITVAALYNINESWSLVSEVRTDEDDLNSDNDITTVAFESLMTF